MADTVVQSGLLQDSADETGSAYTLYFRAFAFLFHTSAEDEDSSEVVFVILLICVPASFGCPGT